MKLRFWLYVCALAVFFGCANDVGVERIGRQASALEAAISVTLTPSTVVYGGSFTVTWSLTNPNQVNGSVSFSDGYTTLSADALVSGNDASGSFEVNSGSLYTSSVCARFNDANQELVGKTCQIIDVVYPPYTETSLTIRSVKDAERTSSFAFGEGIHVDYSVDAFVGDAIVGRSAAVPLGCGDCQQPPASLNGKMRLTYVHGLQAQTVKSDPGIFLKDCDVLDDGSGSCDVSNPGPWVPVGEGWRIIGTFLPLDPLAYQQSSDVSVAFEVHAAGTTVKIASSNTPSPVDAAAHFSVEVDPIDESTAPPTGTVTLFLGDMPISPAISVIPDNDTGVSSVTVEVTDPVLVHLADFYDVSVTYNPDAPNDIANFEGSEADGYEHEVGLDGTTRTYASVPTSWTYGATVSLTVTVAETNPKSGAPTGNVTFYDGASPEPTAQIGSPVLLHDVGGHQVVTLVTTMTALGSRTILAVYDGDAKHTGGALPITQTVSPATPTIQLLIDHESAVFSTPIQLGAKLDRPAGASDTVPLPSGTVHFFYADSAGDGAVYVPFGNDADLGTVGAAAITDTSIPVGTRTIKVKYQPDNSFYAAVETTRGLAINRDPTTFDLRTSKNPATVTGIVRFTATVHSTGTATAIPKGNVVFRDGETPLGTKPLDGTGVAFLETSTLALGEHPITASYDGGTSWGTSNGSLDQQIDIAEVTTNLTSSANPATVGTAVTFTATFGNAVAGPATGTVEFFDGERSLGTGSLTSGIASIVVADLAAGAHSIRVTYPGDGTHSAGSASLSQVMTRVATTTTLTTTAAATTGYGVAIPLTATVTSTSTVPGGSVAFKDGATVLGFAALDATGNAKFTANLLAVGSHAFTAQYFGLDALEPSSSAPLAHTVTKVATVLSVVSSSNPSPLSFSVKFTATVAGVAPGVTPNGAVTFRDGTSTLGSGTLGAGGVATFSTPMLAAGPHVITASYAGDAHFGAADSSPLTQTVSASAAAMTLTSSPNPSTIGGTITIAASLAGGLGTPTGSVTFKQGSTTIGTVTIDGSGNASVTTSALPVGTLTLTAAYTGDTHYGAGTASAAHVVKKVATTIALGASPTTAPVGTAVAFTVTVTSTLGGAAGEVELFDATTSIGTATLGAGGLATFSVSSLAEGQHAVTAAYKGTDTLAEGLSNTIAISITTSPGADAGVDGGADAGGQSSSGGTSSSSGETPPPAGANDAGSSIGLGSSGLNITPGSGDAGDDCSMTPGATGSASVPMLLGLLFVLGRRRRRVVG